MPTTNFTSGLRLEQQPTGGNASTWGTKTDNNIGFLDDALTGQVCADITLGDTTLTVENGVVDEARNAAILIVGNPGTPNDVIIPANKKQYIVRAEHTSVTGGITVRTNVGTGQVFNNGDSATVYCDGVSVHRITPPALDPDSNLGDLTDTSAALVNLGLPYLVSASSLDNTLEVDSSANTLGVHTSAMIELIYPVGSIYINATNAANPATIFGVGTWVSAGQGRVLIGAGEGTDINAETSTFVATSTGGEYKHQLTVAEMPSHSHEVLSFRFNTASAGAGGTTLFQTLSRETTSAGGDQPHNNVQPFVVVYMWERTA
jgi:hypothetical protein